MSGQPACYSTVPIFCSSMKQPRPRPLVFNPTTPNYSFFGGNAEVLKNGNVEYDECASDGRYRRTTQRSMKSPRLRHHKLSGKCRLPDSMPIAAFACPACIPACSGERRVRLAMQNGH